MNKKLRGAGSTETHVEITINVEVDWNDVKNVLCAALSEYRASRCYGVAEAYIAKRYPHDKPGTAYYDENLARIQRNLDISASFLKALRGNKITVTS